jgi:hypothetical protein
VIITPGMSPIFPDPAEATREAVRRADAGPRGDSVRGGPAQQAAHRARVRQPGVKKICVILSFLSTKTEKMYQMNTKCTKWS